MNWLKSFFRGLLGRPDDSHIKNSDNINTYHLTVRRVINRRDNSVKFQYVMRHYAGSRIRIFLDDSSNLCDLTNRFLNHFKARTLDSWGCFPFINPDLDVINQRFSVSYCDGRIYHQVPFDVELKTLKRTMTAQEVLDKSIENLRTVIAAIPGNPFESHWSEATLKFVDGNMTRL